jgi:hypothetical protein
LVAAVWESLLPMSVEAMFRPVPPMLVRGTAVIVASAVSTASRRAFTVEKPVPLGSVPSSVEIAETEEAVARP